MCELAELLCIGRLLGTQLVVQPACCFQDRRLTADSIMGGVVVTRRQAKLDPAPPSDGT